MAMSEDTAEDGPQGAGRPDKEVDAMKVEADGQSQEPVTAEEAAQRLRAELGESVRICILGGTSFQGADSEELVKAMAGELAKSLGESAAFVTGGMAGVQQTFALHCGDGSRVWNLVPLGQSSGFGVGRDIHAGSGLEGRKEVFGLLGELYITVEGGPGVAQEARAAHARGAAVVPLARTGGASGGMFDFPAGALERPPFATIEQWSLLQSGQAPVAEAAAAVAEIAAAFSAHAEAPPAKRPKPSTDDQVAAGDAIAAPAEAPAAVAGSPPGGAEAEAPAPAGATEPEAAAGAQGPRELGEQQPAGLQLSCPPEAPEGHVLQDEDVEHDIEPRITPSGGKKPLALAEGKDDGALAGAGGEPGAHEAASIPRGLISRELLDELSHEPDDFNEGRAAPTPPLAGFETPSETRTPSPRGTPRPQQYYGTAPGHEAHQGVHHEGLMCIDQWDWKTDAPEFVPGSMKGLLDGGGAYQAWAMPPSARGDANGVPESARISQLRAQFDWQLQTKSDELREMQNRTNQLEIETAQVRASWEIERRNLLEQIRHHRAVLERYCIPVEEAKGASFSHADDISGYYTGFEPSAPSQWSSGGAGAGGGGQGAYGNSGGSGWSGGGPSAHGSQGTGGGGRAQSAGAFGSTGGAAGGGGGGAEQGQGPSTLDSKMQQLNSLLQEGNAQTRRRSTSDGQHDAGQHAREPKEQGESKGGGDRYTSGSIASTLRAMFPHATIRTSKADGTGEDKEGHGQETFGSGTSAEAKAVEQQLRRLERSTACTVDERAMHALNGLTVGDAREALQKVEALVHSQGGHCRNLSSILQSVCRKIDKKGGTDGKGSSRQLPEEDGPRAGWSGNGAAATSTREAAQATRAAEAAAAAAAAAAGSGSRGSGGAAGGAATTDGNHSRRARRSDEDGDAFDDSVDSEGEAKAPAKDTPTTSREAPPASDPGQLVRTISTQSQGSNLLDTPAGKRSWADIQSGDEDDGDDRPWTDMVAPSSIGGRSSNSARPAEEPKEDSESWSVQRVENAARRGFELRRRGDHWDLKISMGGLEPAFTQTGMERYCRWLRVRLSSFREEHGSEPLRRCRGEVDFSHNNMNNQMVWMLLETLAQFEVQAALLKLFANHISQGGVLAICEFIRSNQQAEPLQELHLSHNEIDDDSALELFRVLQAHRPRYPPRRPCEGMGDSAPAPVWVRLNHNRIRDPDHVRRTAEAEGITVCTAWDRQACGTSKCSRRECPLVHLYSFNVQGRRRPQESQWQAQSTPQHHSQQSAPEAAAAWGEEADGAAGDQWAVRRKRNRKPGGSKDHKKERDDTAEAEAPGGGDS